MCPDVRLITDPLNRRKRRKNGILAPKALASGKLLQSFPVSRTKLLQSFPVSRVKIIQDGGLAGLEHMVIVCHMFL